MKGKTEIILTDVHTGEQKRVLEQNMTTNALNDIFLQEGYMKDASEMYGSNFQPIYQKLLGGILLFDKTLEENAANYFAPAGTNLTACGVYGVKNTTGDTLRGDYNSDESYLDTQAKTMKYVYDFSTSKGNGTIASVCLTSANGGYSSYGASVNGGTGQIANFFLHTGSGRNYTSYNGEQVIAIDYKNDVVYTFTPNVQNYKLVSVTIRKRRAHMKTLPVVYSASSAGRVLEAKDVALGNIGSGYGWNYDPSENALYFISGGSNSSAVYNGNSVYISAIPLDTFTVSNVSCENRTGISLYVGRCAVYKGYLFVSSSGNSLITSYKINIANDNDVQKITSTVYLDFSKAFLLGGNFFVAGDAYNSSDYRLCVLDFSESIARPTQTSGYFYNVGRYVPVIGSNIAFAQVNDGNNFKVPCNYLATINNLSSPVTKTAAQTMKVIYTISEG